MRKHLIWVLGLVVAIGSVVAAGIAIAAPNTQSIVGSIKPKKLPKNERKPISLDVNVFSTNSGNANNIPNPTTLAKVDFSKNILFQQTGYPTCETSQFGSSSTTQDVKDECGDAVIGSGSATINVPTAGGGPPVVVKPDVVAANVKGNKILLHSHNSLSGGTPLVGQIQTKKSGGGKYGLTLTVPVPPLAGGAAVITQFGAVIDKVAYNHKGKKLAIISSNCKDKTMDFQARFTDDEGQLATGSDTYKCKRKG